MNFRIHPILLAVVIGCPCAATAGEIRALLVGIGDYPVSKEQEFPKLEGPGNDLRIMRDWLVNDLGAAPGSVEVLRDGQATCRGIQEAFDHHLIRGSRPDDVVVFYFSGHGTQMPDFGPEADEDDGWDETLVTYDFNGEDTATWLTDDVIHRQLLAVPARHVLVLFDCCHAGSATRGVRGVPSPFAWNTRSLGPTDTSLREKDSPEHHVYFAACGDGELARQVYDAPSDGIVGVFTLAFRELAKGSPLAEPLSVFEVALRDDVRARVREKLSARLDQQPVLDAARRDFALKSFLAGRAFAGQESVALAVPPPPGVLEGFTPGGRIRVALGTDKARYLWTEELVASVTVDRPAYVRVFHLDSKGAVTQIHPNSILPQALLKPGESLRLPPPVSVTGRTYDLRVTGPEQGIEALVAVASTEPFTDREAREFAAGLFNPIPDAGPADLMTRGIAVEPRDNAADPDADPDPGAPAFGQAVRVYRTSQYR